MHFQASLVLKLLSLDQAFENYVYNKRSKKFSKKKNGVVDMIIDTAIIYNQWMKLM